MSDATATGVLVQAFDTSGGAVVPLADYVIDGAFAVSPATFAVSFLGAGFLDDIDGRFDFQLDELLEFDDDAGETILSLDDEVVSDEGARVRVITDGVSGDDGSSDFIFVMTIDGPTGDTRVELEVIGDQQTGRIEQNGRLEVFVSGTVDLPIFSAADGGFLTGAEIAALDAILFAIDDVLILGADLLLPLSGVFGLE